MKADEYDDLTHDPTGYFTQKYLPRVFGALSGFPLLPFFPGILEIYGLGLSFIPYGLPPVQALKPCLKSAEALKGSAPCSHDGVLAMAFRPWGVHQGALRCHRRYIAGYQGDHAGYPPAAQETP
jgi:hypothetical protein